MAYVHQAVGYTNIGYSSIALSAICISHGIMKRKLRWRLSLATGLLLVALCTAVMFGEWWGGKLEWAYKSFINQTIGYVLSIGFWVLVLGAMLSAIDWVTGRQPAVEVETTRDG